MTDAAGALERAADLLETVGWVTGIAMQYGYKESDPVRLLQVVGYCASGAVVKAASNSVEYQAAMAALSCKIRQGMQFVATTSRDTVVAWNDARGRTKSEVIDAMRHAAKDLRNEAVPS